MKVVFDIENLSNLFSLCAINVDTLREYQFVIHKDRDDSEALREFLGNCKVMIGFNSLDYDYPVTHHFLTAKLPKKPANIASSIYAEAQKIIQTKNSGGFVSIREPLIYQIDLFRIWHFDNPAKATSLKYLAINMGFPNIQDMPLHHTSHVELMDIPMILEYNMNDVRVTLEFYKRTLGKLEMRRKLTEKYTIDMTNFPDPKIGETIVLKKLSEKTGTSMEALRKCRTFRKEIRLRDAILPSVNFKTDEFRKIYEAFAQMVVTDTRKSDELVATLDDVDYYFGMGGIHACRSNGVFRDVSSCDVGGYYPSLAVAQGFYPYHFGQDFVQVYAEIAKERAVYEKGTDESTALKLAQNGVFGKSNSEFSPFYDPLFFMKITINGQLLLAMLCERITMMKAGRIILANTDGIEVDVTDREKYMWICGEWEKKFGLKLEHGTYRLLAVRDINSYIAISSSGKAKLKGAFKTVDQLIKDGELHKDFSASIIKEAVLDYFLKGTPVESTISSCTDIGKFMIGDRVKSGGKFVLKELRNGELIEEPLSKNIRYYVSKGGGTLMRVGNGKGNDSQVIKGYQVTIANKWPETIRVNHQYYAKEARKMVHSIIGQ